MSEAESNNDVLQQHSLHQMRQRMQRWRVLAYASLLIVAGTLAWSPVQGWWQEYQQAKKAESGKAAVHTHTVTSRMLENHKTINGIIEPLRTVELNAALDATVQHIHVRFGETVHQGDLLFELEPAASFIARIKQLQQRYALERQKLATLQHISTGMEARKAQRNVLRQQQQLEKSQRNLKEDRLLYEQGVVSQSQVESSQQATIDAQMALDEAREAWQAELNKGSKQALAQQQLMVDSFRLLLADVEEKYTRRKVYAPMDGILLKPLKKDARNGGEANISEGQSLREGKGLARIADMSQLRVSVVVSGEDIVQYKPGLKAKASVRSLPGTVLDAYTDSVSRDPLFVNRREGNQASYEIGLLIPNLTGEQRDKMRIGMNVEADIELSPPYQALMIPIDAVRVSHKVFEVRRLRDDGSEETVKIVTGTTTLSDIEVLAGLKAGDRIVMPGA